MAHLYFDETLSAAALQPGEVVTIRGEEARHAVRVARLRVGEHIQIGNGSGVTAESEVLTVAKESFSVRCGVVSVQSLLTPELWLVQALAKGDRDERAIEQATELGIDQIVPWQANRSVSRWETTSGVDKAAKGIEKWQRIAREAAKQSIRSWVPHVHQLAATDDLCQFAVEPGTAVLVLHPRDAASLSSWATQLETTNFQRIILVVGPEGGITDAELNRLEASGAQIVVLGSAVLRTSSAGPAAVAMLNTLTGRW